MSPTTSASPQAMLNALLRHRALILTLAKREVLGRYRGSVMGLSWSFFNPLLMLAVYTFVFSVVFEARWPGGSDSRTEFALVLFTGLIAFGLFAECINRAPGLVTGNASYVTKVVFPLEILPAVSLLSALFHATVSFSVWLVFHLLVRGAPPLTIWQAPLAIVPLVLITLGLSWWLASLGVFLRDVPHVVGVLTTMLMFLSPIFFALDAVPESFRAFMVANPLTNLIEDFRAVALWGRGLRWGIWAQQVALSVFVAWLGFVWFQKTRTGFADVL